MKSRTLGQVASVRVGPPGARGVGERGVSIFERLDGRFSGHLGGVDVGSPGCRESIGECHWARRRDTHVHDDLERSVGLTLPDRGVERVERLSVVLPRDDPAHRAR
jgi:hypothetical protein